jgi:hypothetical protein
MRYQRINNFLGSQEQDNLNQPTATIPFTTEDMQTGTPAANPMVPLTAMPAATTTPDSQAMRQDIIAQMAQPNLEESSAAPEQTEQPQQEEQARRAVTRRA